MFNSNFPDPELLKALLQNLLEDFQHWFERSAILLETEEIPFLNAKQQSDLLVRVKQTQQEIRTTQMLFHLMGGKVGVEMAVLIPWQNLLTECWQVAMRFRLEQSANSGKK